MVSARLREELRLFVIFHFGSVARGSETEWSDLDLCLLFDEMPGRNLDVMRMARSISPSVKKGAMDIEAYIARGSSFELRLQREAISL